MTSIALNPQVQKPKQLKPSTEAKPDAAKHKPKSSLGVSTKLNLAQYKLVNKNPMLRNNFKSYQNREVQSLGRP